MGKTFGEPLVELVAEALEHEKAKGNTYRVAVPSEWVTVKAQDEKEAAEKAVKWAEKRIPAKDGEVKLSPDNVKLNVKGKVN